MSAQKTLVGKTSDVKVGMNVEGEQASGPLDAPVGDPDPSHEERSVERSIEALLVILALADAVTRGLGSVIASFVAANDDVVVESDFDQDGHG